MTPRARRQHPAVSTAGPGQESVVSRLLETFAVIWRLAHPYFYSEDRKAGRILLAGVVLM